MTTPSSPSRAEALLREAIELEAGELYLQADGDKARVRYRVSGRIVQKLNGFVDDAQSLFDELKALPTQEVVAEENERLGYFSFPVENRTLRVRLYWFRDEDGDAVAISFLERWHSFDDLGLRPQDAAMLDELISFPQGVVIGCGEVDGGHATTLGALLERLVRRGKRVVLLTGQPDPRLENVTQLDITQGELSEHIELLTGHFDVFALDNLDSDEKVQVAFKLAAEGHLVLALRYAPIVATTLSDFLNSGISHGDLQAHFLGGWSQTLVPLANQAERTGLFYCLSREESQQQILEAENVDISRLTEAQSKALWRDAEAKIAVGLISREEAEQVI